MRRRKKQQPEVEDISDCETCTKRNRDGWELMQEAECKTLGSAFCQECGRQYAVLAREEDCESDEKRFDWEGDDDDDDDDE